MCIIMSTAVVLRNVSRSALLFIRASQRQMEVAMAKLKIAIVISTTRVYRKHHPHGFAEGIA
jgi:hypothetical protein